MSQPPREKLCNTCKFARVHFGVAYRVVACGSPHNVSERTSWYDNGPLPAAETVEACRLSAAFCGPEGKWHDPRLPGDLHTFYGANYNSGPSLDKLVKQKPSSRITLDDL